MTILKPLLVPPQPPLKHMAYPYLVLSRFIRNTFIQSLKMSTSYSMTPNYSIYALPAFYGMALVPLFYGNSIVMKATGGRIDFANPRGAATQENYRKSCDAATYATIERCKAAHNNAMENMPLFFAAVIVANMAGLDTGVMNFQCGLFLALRAVYTVLYIGVSNQNFALVRSVTWMTSVVGPLYLMVKAGNVMVDRK